MDNQTMIIVCDCKHDDQDQMYGKGRRVHNRSKDKTSGRWENARCTVCGKVVRATQEVVG